MPEEARIAADQPVPVRLQLPPPCPAACVNCGQWIGGSNVTALTAFQVGGRVSHVYVEEGQRVTKGQILADLDPRIIGTPSMLHQAKQTQLRR